MDLTKRGVLGAAALSAVVAATGLPALAAPVPVCASLDGAGALSLIRLDQAIDCIADPAALLMNKRLRSRMVAASVFSPGFITWDMDGAHGRRAYYNDLPIHVADYDSSDRLSLDLAEASLGVGTTSVYVLGRGAHDQLRVIEQALIELPWVGAHAPLSEQHSYLERKAACLDRKAYFILGLKHRDDVVRLSGITDTAVTV